MRAYLFLPLIIIIFSACEKTENVVDFPKHDSKLAVSSLFSTDTNIVVNVSKSLSVLDNKEVSPIAFPQIKLWENGNLISPVIKKGDKGNFEIMHVPVEGNSYTIEVSAENLETVTATDFVQRPPTVLGHSFQILDSSYSSYSNFGNFLNYYGRLQAKIRIQIKDNPEEENYYEIRVGFSSDLFDNDTTTVRTVTGNFSRISCNDPSVVQTFYNSIFLSDKLFNGNLHEFVIDINDFNQWGYTQDLVPDSEIYVTITTHSKSSFLYNRSLRLYYQNMHDPFAEPVRIYNNIENGYGIFAGHSNKTIRVK